MCGHLNVIYYNTLLKMILSGMLVMLFGMMALKLKGIFE